MMLIVAMNADSRSGAIGSCVCLADAASGSFQIPAYALANVPPTPAHARGLPLNLILLVQLPLVPETADAGTGVDRILAFTASIFGRTVQFQ